MTYKPSGKRTGWVFWIRIRGAWSIGSGWLFYGATLAAFAFGLLHDVAGKVFLLVTAPAVLYSLFVPLRVTIFPDGIVEFRSVLHRRRVPVAEVMSVESNSPNGLGAYITLAKGWPVRMLFRMERHADMLAKLRELNPYMAEL